MRPIYINELLPKISQVQDSKVELFNPNDGPVNVSGWYLTDNFNKPKKYRLPNGTFIEPNGYFVLSENSFASADGSNFSFSADDAIALMAEARRRAREQFGVELVREVEFLGPLELPPL